MIDTHCPRLTSSALTQRYSILTVTPCGLERGEHGEGGEISAELEFIGPPRFKQGGRHPQFPGHGWSPFLPLEVPAGHLDLDRKVRD